MVSHAFIFQPGSWLGEGKIQLSLAEDPLPFYMKWTIPPADDRGHISCTQEIQISGIAESMYNHFLFSDITKKEFAIELENQSLGKIIGQGIIASNTIGWEFRLSHLGFEGFEFYEEKDEGYLMHAEYATTDDFRTTVHGKIWKKDNIEEEKLI